MWDVRQSLCWGLNIHPLVRSILNKAENYRSLAVQAKGCGHLQEANEWFLRSDTLREAARLAQGYLDKYEKGRGKLADV